MSAVSAVPTGVTSNGVSGASRARVPPGCPLLMRGACRECGRPCREKADDGNYYCDDCWRAWTTKQDAKDAQARAAARLQREASRRAELAAAAREKEARMRASEQREREAKESAYWEARGKIVRDRLDFAPPERPKEALPDAKVPAAFWGICDVKYDPRLPVRDRVKVLELGDGRSSRFSHHGAVLKERFEAHYCLEPFAMRRGVLVDNKKLTHDTFELCGFSHLRPRQLAYTRCYTVDLAKRIVRDLQLEEDAVVVLKLVNRSRGAGVVVCPVAQLDNTLRELLTPPPDMGCWLEDHAPRALTEERSEVLTEQKLHYWSNECPLFVAETLCRSLPVRLPEDEDEDQDSKRVFDGTMRVAFILRRQAKDDTKLDIEWLGGYWKLPRDAVKPPLEGFASSGSIEEIHASLVSSFNSEEKRTAVVEQEHLQEVFVALEPALPSVFERGSFSAKELIHSYPQDAPFRAFATVRCAAAMRASGDLSKSLWVAELARKMIKSPVNGNASNVTDRSVLSYLERTMGVNQAIVGKWPQAEAHFAKALELQPANATAHYLKGVCLQEDGQFALAADCHLRSLALDPDFRSAAVFLGECWLQLRRYHDTVAACRACLRRQPDAPVAQYYIGQAIYQMLLAGHVKSEAERAELRRQVLAALETAKEGACKVDRWGDAEEAILAFARDGGGPEAPHQHQPVRPWRSYGWRP